MKKIITKISITTLSRQLNVGKINLNVSSKKANTKRNK